MTTLGKVNFIFDENKKFKDPFSERAYYPLRGTEEDEKAKKVRFHDTIDQDAWIFKQTVGNHERHYHYEGGPSFEKSYVQNTAHLRWLTWPEKVMYYVTEFLAHLWIYKVFARKLSKNNPEKFMRFKQISENYQKQLLRRHRYDEEMHDFVTKLTDSKIFEWFIILTIALNTVMMGIEIHRSIAVRYYTLFFVLDEIFVGIYTVEFLLKIYARPVEFWFSVYNLFDIFVLVISYVESIVNQYAQAKELEALRLIRALRAVRAMRTISFIKGLQVLVTAFINTLKLSVVNLTLLMLIVVFLAAVFGYYFFGEAYYDDWGTLNRSFQTLLIFVMVDGWADFQGKWDEEPDMRGSRLFSVAFIFIGNFIIANIFVGVIIMHISDATEMHELEEKQKRSEIVEVKKEYMKESQDRQIIRMLKKQRQGTFPQFANALERYKSSLRHNTYIITNEMAANLIWLETLIKNMGHMETTMMTLQQLQYELVDNLATLLEIRMDAQLKTPVTRSYRTPTVTKKTFSQSYYLQDKISQSSLFKFIQ